MIMSFSLMTGSAVNSKFCFPSTIMEGLVETKLTVFLGACQDTLQTEIVHEIRYCMKIILQPF